MDDQNDILDTITYYAVGENKDERVEISREDFFNLPNIEAIRTTDNIRSNYINELGVTWVPASVADGTVLPYDLSRAAMTTPSETVYVHNEGWEPTHTELWEPLYTARWEPPEINEYELGYGDTAMAYTDEEYIAERANQASAKVEALRQALSAEKLKPSDVPLGELLETEEN